MVGEFTTNLIIYPATLTLWFGHMCIPESERSAVTKDDSIRSSSTVCSGVAKPLKYRVAVSIRLAQKYWTILYATGTAVNQVGDRARIIRSRKPPDTRRTGKQSDMCKSLVARLSRREVRVQLKSCQVATAQAMSSSALQ